MREISIRLYDDLDYAADGTRTEAAVTITIGFNGSWRELDLSEENHAQLQKLFREWMDAGRRPPETAPAEKPGYHRGSATIPRESFERGAALRQFANENGISYRTKTGKYYYSKKLREAYANSLAKKNK